MKRIYINPIVQFTDIESTDDFMTESSSKHGYTGSGSFQYDGGDEDNSGSIIATEEEEESGAKNCFAFTEEFEYHIPL